jgi:signal transduction histidine kinase
MSNLNNSKGDSSPQPCSLLGDPTEEKASQKLPSISIVGLLPGGYHARTIALSIAPPLFASGATLAAASVSGVFVAAGVAVVSSLLFGAVIWWAGIEIKHGFDLIRWMIDEHQREKGRQSQQETKPVDLSRFAPEIQQAIERVCEVLESHREISQYRSRMLHMAAHDTMQPAQAIQMAAKAQTGELRSRDRSRTDDTLYRMAQIIHVSSQRQIEMMDSIVQMMQSREGDLDIETSTGHLNEAVRDIVEEVRPVARYYDVQVEMEMFTSLYVTTDMDKVRQIILYLLSTAVRAAKTKVRIGTQMECGEISIFVEDDSSGLDEEEVESIFHPKEGETTSLGLWLAKSFAERLGGMVEVSSAPGEGTAFVVTFEASAIRARSTQPEEDAEILHLSDGPERTTIEANKAI